MANAQALALGRVVPTSRARGRVAVLICIGTLLVGITWLYRFGALGGPLGGFSNDQFVTLSEAQEVLLGDLPLPGWDGGQPLPVILSAWALASLGRSLFAEAVLTITLLGISTAVLFWLCWRATRAMSLSIAIALMQIVMAPRFYNYPKLLAYAIAIPACWWYIDHPSRRRLALMSASVAVAFLLRHDHGVYAFIGLAAAIAMSHRDLGRAVTDTIIAATLVVIFLLPYLVWIQVHGGVASYVRTFSSFVDSEVSHTTLQTPRFDIDWSAPLVLRTAPRRDVPRINVRWAPAVTDAVRAEHERALGLRLVEVRESSIRNYALEDSSRERLAQVVHDAAIIDTHGIDRVHFVLNDPAYTRRPGVIERAWSAAKSYRLLPGIWHSANAVPFLYYLMWALPLVVLAMLAIAGDRAVPHAWSHGVEKIALVALLALLIDRGFLRGNLPSRLADVTEVTGVLGAWAAAVLTAPRRRQWVRVAGVAGTLLVMMATILSANALVDVPVQVAQGRLFDGIQAFRAHWLELHELLTADAPVSAFDADTPGVTQVARYINVCTTPNDRVLVLSYLPEVFFLSGRGYAGGRVWIRPNYLTSDDDQSSIITKTSSRRVPIVLTEAEPTYSDDFVESFPRLDAFLRSRYDDRGTFDFGRDLRLRVLVRRDLQPTGRFPIRDLPCFS